MALSYLPSNRIWIFPCSNRSGLNDVESHLFTERNLRNLSYNALGKNQVLKVTSLTSGNTLVEFIIAGYFVRIELTSTEVNENTTIYANLKFKDKNIISVTGEGLGVDSPVIRHYDNETLNNLDENGVFKGIKFTASADSTAVSYCIRNAGTWKTGEYYLPTASDKTTWDAAKPGTVTQITAGKGLNTSDNKAESATKGSITTTGTLHLTTTGVTAGTYQGITVDKYGRITGAANQNYLTSFTWNGITINSTNTTVNPYCSCTTLGDVAAKVVTGGTGIPENPTNGLELLVFFTFQNTVDNPTLKLGTTGTATPIFYGTANITGNSKYLLYGFVKLKYTGSGWQLLLASSSNVTQKINSTNDSFPVLFSSSTSTSSDNTELVYKNPSVKINPLTGTLYATTFSENGSTLTSKYNAKITASPGTSGSQMVYLVGLANGSGFNTDVTNISQTYASPYVYYDQNGRLYARSTSSATNSSLVLTKDNFSSDFSWDGSTNKITLNVSNASSYTPGF